MKAFRYAHMMVLAGLAALTSLARGQENPATIPAAHHGRPIAVSRTDRQYPTVFAPVVSRVTTKAKTQATLVGVRHRVPQDYTTIQGAIDASTDGDTVLVSEGTYFENIRYRGKAIVVGSLYLTDGDSVHIANTIIDGSGSAIADSSSVVYFISGEDTTSILCGFTIRGGTGTNHMLNAFWGSGWARVGGGILCLNSGPCIRSNLITRNRIVAPVAIGGAVEAIGYGAFTGYVVLDANRITDNSVHATSTSSPLWGGSGGVDLSGANARVVNNVIERDTAIGYLGVYGGGMTITASTDGYWPTAEITGNAFRSNYAAAQTQGVVGGGMELSWTGNVTVNENSFENNVAVCPSSSQAVGGGVHATDQTKFGCGLKTFLHNRFLNNVVSCPGLSDGGGLEFYKASFTISGCIFDGNRLTGTVAGSTGGGAGVSTNTSSFRIENSIFINNVSDLDGGGLLVSSENQVTEERILVNCTIVGNRAGRGGGGMAVTGLPSFVSRNNIFWNDSAQTGSEVYPGTAEVNMECCDVQGGYSGLGNIDADPGFALPRVDSLTNDSPCIGAGTLSGAPTIDIHGHPRPQPPGSMPDMGAEESPIGPLVALSASRSEVDFGFAIVTVGSDSVGVSVKNIAAHNVVIDSLLLTNTDFYMVNAQVLPDTLAPSDSILVQVGFSPARRGISRGSLIVKNHGSLDLGVSVSLQGEGMVCGPQFIQLVNRVRGVPEGNRSAVVDSFWTGHPVMPLIENDSLCEFLYRGSATSVAVPGDVNEWVAASAPMQRLASTDLWYWSEVLYPDARVEYKFLVNGGTWIPDPRNPLQVPPDSNSEVRMPAYVQPPELFYYSAIPHGTLQDTSVYSTNLGGPRNIRIYLPPGYDATDSCAVVVFHDGFDFIQRACADRVLDYVHWKQSFNHFLPLIGVFVPPVDRNAEYMGALRDQYAAFIATELMPFIRSQYKARRSHRGVATMGISAGGNISLWIARNYPSVFGNAASMSGAIQPSTSAAFQSGEPPDVFVYVDVGTYDLAGFEDLSSQFDSVLGAQWYNRRFYQWHEGHSWRNWGAHIDEALAFFDLGRTTHVSEPNSVPSAFALEQNYPNPFNPRTTIKYTVAGARSQGLGASEVRIVIYDVLGREVATLVNAKQMPGEHEVRFDGRALSSGVYFYRLSAGSYTAVRRMLLVR